MSNQIENFKHLISFLNSKEIDYALLGRRGSLQEIVAGDIDLVISNKDFKNLSVLVREFSIQHDLQMIQCFEHEITAKYYVLSDKKDHSMISPDFCSAFMRDKRLLIPNELLMSNRQSLSLENQQVYTLTPEFEFTYYLLKKIDKKSLELSAINHLAMQFEASNIELIKDLLSKYFGANTIELICKEFETQTPVNLHGLLPKISNELNKNIPIRASHYLLDLLLKVKRVLFKTGASVAILGSDGSGKSSVINGISVRLKPAFRKVQYYHLYPKSSEETKNPNTSPQAQSAYSFLISQIKLLHFASRYWRGCLNVYSKKVRSTFIIFDRYFDDIIVDNKRFRYKGPQLPLKLVHWFIPKPAVYIYLNAPSDVIFKRKAELPIQELDRQQEVYLSLLKKKKQGFVINANQELDRVIFDAESKVLDYLEQRQLKRT